MQCRLCGDLKTTLSAGPCLSPWTGPLFFIAVYSRLSLLLLAPLPVGTHRDHWCCVTLPDFYRGSRHPNSHNWIYTGRSLSTEPPPQPSQSSHYIKDSLEGCDAGSWDRVSLCITGWPGTCYVDQAGCELTEICLCLSTKSLGSVVPVDQPFLDSSYNWNHTVCGLLSMASFI